MLYFKTTLFLLFFSCLYQPIFSQPFRCDGRLILSAVTENTTTYNVIFAPFGAVFYSPFASFQGENFDAIGFNPIDNYIYGVKENTNSIVRLRADGSHEVIGTAPQVDILQSYAGDCTPRGKYMCHENTLNKILVFDVADNFALVEELDLFWDPASENAGPFTTRIDDFAIDPNNPGIAYSFQGSYLQDDYQPANTRGYLLKINIDFSDPNVGMVTPIAPIPSSVVWQLGSLFFTGGGALYGLGPYTTGAFIQNRLISINTNTAEATIQGISTPLANASDGCSCSYGLYFTNDIRPRDIPCSSSELDYILTITNRSYLELSGLSLTDTLPVEMAIKDISGDFKGDIEVGTGVGTKILTINNLQVPARGSVQITIHAEVIDVLVGSIPNQAFLRNLPLLFDGSRVSDDPQTPGIAPDPSNYLSEPQPLDDATLEIIQPSDCLNANDAQVIVSSPLLQVGKNYKVMVRNKNWEEFHYNFLIGNNKRFVIDSLLPGEYHISQVTLENSLCSFGWKEQPILIEAPNEQLQVTVSTNSPICAGVDLELNATLSPAGSAYWTGPERFGSEEWNPIIDTASADYSGNFKMVATYGFCEQTRETEVFISPKIQATIEGDSAYCERTPMRLAATGNGELTGFSWSGPNTITSDSQKIIVSSISPPNEGFYEVVIDNGFCKDTATKAITVLPSPTIELPGLIETDFCTPLKLRPVITGDADVTYQWTRRNGLDCYDCPTPELQVPFLPSYRLAVQNEIGCADTSVVQVVLDKEQLLYVPNVFSPNFDGRNDYFQMFPYCGISHLKNLEIYDRWGAVVFSKKELDHLNPSDYWDGRIKGNLATTGVYIWQVEMVLVDGTVLRRSGDVSILR